MKFIELVNIEMGLDKYNSFEETARFLVKNEVFIENLNEELLSSTIKKSAKEFLKTNKETDEIRKWEDFLSLDIYQDFCTHTTHKEITVYTDKGVLEVTCMLCNHVLHEVKNS